SNDPGRSFFVEIVTVCGSFVPEFSKVTVPPEATVIVPGAKCLVSWTSAFVFQVSLPGVFTTGPPPRVAAIAAPATTSIRTAAVATAYLLLTQPLLVGRVCPPAQDSDGPRVAFQLSDVPLQ